MLKISVILIHCLCYHCISIMVLNTKVKINNYISQLSISAWNVHGLGDKINDNFFVEKLSSDINILLETWTGVKPKANLQDYLSISKCRKKKKRSKRHSGGIIVFYKMELTLGITYIQNGTKSENRLWLKLDKKVFGLESDLYICAVYIPPASSTHFDNDIVKLENEISIFANRGKILLIGDFNCRTGHNPDYIINDSTDLNDFGCKHLLPQNYSIDEIPKRRHNQDNICNTQCLNLLDLCISSQLRILNGRYVGDSLGYFTCLTVNGLSSVDYAIASESLLSSVLYFSTQEINYLSDHVQIKLLLKCKLQKNATSESIFSS